MRTNKSDNKLNNLLISVVIIAKDEEMKIGDCLESVKWVDEIVLIDTGSADKTKQIAKKYKAKIVDYPKGSYSDWRNKGKEIASGEWILYVDADERITGELRKEIQNIILASKSGKSPVAYAIPRKNIILGKELRRGGWWPDYVIRLFIKNSLEKWKNELHEQPIYKGDLGYLKNAFLHIKHDNLHDMVEKTNIWSEVEARLMFEANHPMMNVPRFISAMSREFFLRMIKNRAFLDGGVGIIYALYQVYSRFISYAKLWEMQMKIHN